MKSLALATSLLLAGWSAGAQELEGYLGTWLASGPGLPDSEFTIRSSGGTWRTFSHRTSTPCLRLNAPATVISASSEDLILSVEASRLLAGCPDFEVRMKRVDPNTLAGTIPSQSLSFQAKRK